MAKMHTSPVRREEHPPYLHFLQSLQTLFQLVVPAVVLDQRLVQSPVRDQALVYALHTVQANIISTASLQGKNGTQNS